MRDTGATDQQGRGIFQGSLVGATNWAVHWLPERDHGIDGIVELTDKDGKPDGGRVALQVKSGPSYFSRPKKDKDGNVLGWWRPVPVRHRTYWLKQAMPVYVVLVNTDTGEWCYERITNATCVRSGSGYRVFVPATQHLERATVQWRQDAETYRALTRQGHAELAKLLPPSAGDGLEKLATVDARLADLVAAHLVGVDPELNVQFLLSASESWLKSSPSHLFATIGSFASEHELYSLGADALEIASAAHDVDAERQGVLLALAGMLAAGADDTRTQDLLDRAERTASVAGKRRVELARIQYDPDKLAAFRPEAWRGSDDPGLASQAALVGFVHHRGAGRIDAAVAELRRSLELQPRATRQMVWQADMLLLRASTSQAHPGDPAAALDLVRRASQQRKLWHGPTQDLFALELKALVLLSRQEEALALIEAALGDDDRTASLLSDRVALAMTADIVAAIGREDLLDRLISVLEPTSIARQVLEFRRPSGHDQDTGEAWLALGSALVGRAVDASDARMAMSVISVLAGRGADVDGLLDKLDAADLLTTAQVRTLKAQFLAERNLDAGLPHLRHAGRTEMGAAEVLLHMLVRAGRLDEAVAELNSLAAHHSKAALAPIVVHALRQAGRVPEAAELALAGLANSSLEGRDRFTLVRVALDAAASKNDWERVESLAREELARLSQQDTLVLRPLIQDYTWVRLAALTRLRRHPDAVEVLASVSLRPDDPLRLTTWAQVTAYRGFEADDVQMLLACINEIRPDSELTAWLLRLAWESFTIGDAARRNSAKQAAAQSAGANVDDLQDDATDEAVLATPEGRAGRALYEALERHQAEHGKISGLDARQMGEGGAGIEELIEDLTAMLRAQAERLDTAIKHVLAEQPLGLVAVAANRPYARAVIGRVIGYLPAVSHNESVFEAEVQAAAGALGGAVVVEASTLHTVDRLDRDSLTGNFTELLLSQRARDDITSGLLASRADLAASGHMGFDRVQGRPTMSEGRDPDADLLVARARRLEELAALCRIVPVDVEHYGPNSELFGVHGATTYPPAEDLLAREGDAEDGEIDDGHEVDPAARAAAMGPWLDAVELAADLGLPLWSDDLGLRKLASARGVATFSTPALLEALLDEMRLPEGEVPGLRARLLRAGVADLNVTDEELGAMVAEAAELRDSDPAAVRELVTAVGMKLSRPSYAEVRQTTFLGDVRKLIVSARMHESGWAETFCYQALTGLALRALPVDGVLRAAIELSFGGTPVVDPRRTARYLELARQVVIAHHDQDPIADLPSILENSLADVVGKDDFVARVLEALLPTAETAE